MPPMRPAAQPAPPPAAPQATEASTRHHSAGVGFLESGMPASGQNCLAGHQDVGSLSAHAGFPRLGLSGLSFTASQLALDTSHISRIMCRVEVCRIPMSRWLPMPALICAGRWEPAEAAFTAALAAAAPGADQARQVCYLAACRLLQACPSLKSPPSLSFASRCCHAACR